jgi:hypothetical protein
LDEIRPENVFVQVVGNSHNSKKEGWCSGAPLKEKHVVLDYNKKLIMYMPNLDDVIRKM